jgi:hypothetical protein
MQTLDNATLRERLDDAVRREKQRMRGICFGVSLFMFIVFLLISILVVANTDIPIRDVNGIVSPLLAPLIMLGIGWFSTVLFQGALLLMDMGVMDRGLRDRMIAQEMGRQLYEQAAGAYEKPKRQFDDAIEYAVSDDGELVEVVDEAPKAARGET